MSLLKADGFTAWMHYSSSMVLTSPIKMLCLLCRNSPLKQIMRFQAQEKMQVQGEQERGKKGNTEKAPFFLEWHTKP